jgi:2-succinyl-5-enolpyruvyl-6-hydroxy-3-cyclohexene-1-carboxylate synthase
VHLNLPFREPLVPTGEPLVEAPGRADGAPFVSAIGAHRRPDDASVDALARSVRAHPRSVLVAGWGAGVDPVTATSFAEAAGWPILADPLSNLRCGPFAVSTYDAVAREPENLRHLEPEMVVRVGAPPTSKALGGWLERDVPTVLVDPDDAWLDPPRRATTRITADAGPLFDAVAAVLARGPAPDQAWLDGWRQLEDTARRVLDEACDADPDPFEGRVARDVVAAVPDGTTVVVASSMPVRDVESFAQPRSGVRFLANRGVNGIDAFVGTVLGAATGDEARPVVALLGDLCFLHDRNALLGAAARGVDAVLVVIDNDGGGIFSFLPQAGALSVDDDDFVALFATPHGVDLAQVAGIHGIPCAEIEKASELATAVTDAIRGGGVRVVLVRTDRDDNVARHRAVWSAVADALR